MTDEVGDSEGAEVEVEETVEVDEEGEGFFPEAPVPGEFGPVLSRALAKAADVAKARENPFGKLTSDEFFAKHWNLEAKGGEGEWAWPEGHGAELGTEAPQILEEGQILDRFGTPGGRFLSPDGATWGERSLPPDSVLEEPLGEYHRYQVLKPFEVTQGTAAPAFEQHGGGVQYMSQQGVRALIDNGYLRELLEG